MSKACSRCGEIKALEEFYKRRRTKEGRRSECKECSKASEKEYYLANREAVNSRTQAWARANPMSARARSKAWYEANKERKAAKGRAWREANKERDQNYNKAWYEENKERSAALSRAWREANPERVKANNKAWHQTHLDKRNASGAKYRAARLQRTVAWSNNEVIEEVYAEARRLSETTGIQFHVDHVIPLQGKLVSGLHVETNLQILMAHDNSAKSNNFKI